MDSPDKKQLHTERKIHRAQARNNSEIEQSLGVEMPTGGSADNSKGPKKHKVRKSSRHGALRPALPISVVRKLAVSFAGPASDQSTKINKATIGAIMQASAWFWEQVGTDLRAYAEHAGRKTIDESDITMLMNRQVFQ